MTTQHGRARNKNKITHNCCNFGVMGGLAPVTGRPNAHIASRSANRNPVPCNLDCDKAKKWLAGDNPLGKNMLSVNPTYSGGVGFLKKSNRKCNCGSSPSGIDMRFINYGANKFYVLIFTSAAKPDDLDAPEYWAQHYQAYLKQISLFGNSVIDHQFIWFGTPIMHISSRNGLHITYGEGQLSETEALRAQHGFITKIMPELPWSPLLVISTFQPVNQEDTLTEETRQALANLAEHPSTNVVTYHETQDISKDVVGFYGHTDNAMVNQALTSILKHAEKKGWITHKSWEKYADREILTVLVNHKAVSDDPQHYYFLKEHIRNLSNISVSTEDLINLNLRDINRKLYYNDTVKITMVATTYESAVYCLAWMEHYGVHHDDAIIVILDHDEDIQQLMNEERNIMASSHKVNHIPSLISAMAVGAHDLVHYKLSNKKQPRPYLTGNSSTTTSTYTGSAESNWPTSTTSKFKLDENGKIKYNVEDPIDGPCVYPQCTGWISAMLTIWNHWINYRIPNAKIFFSNSDIWKQYSKFTKSDESVFSERIYTLKNALPLKGIFGLNKDLSLHDLLSNEISTTGNINQLMCQIGDKPLYYPSTESQLTLDDSIAIVDLINSTTDNVEGVLNNSELCIATLDVLDTLQKLISPKYIDYSITNSLTTNVYTKDQDLLYNANTGIELLNYINTVSNEDRLFGNKHLNHHLSKPIVKSITTSTENRFSVAIRYQFEYYYDTSGNKRWSQVSEPTISNNFEVISVPPDIVSIVINNKLNASNSNTLGVRWYICDPNSSMMGYLAHEYPNEIHTPDSLYDAVSNFLNDTLIQWSFPFSINRDILNITTSNPYPMLLDSIVTNNDTDYLQQIENDNTIINNIINNISYSNQHDSSSSKNTLLGFIDTRYNSINSILSKYTTFGNVTVNIEENTYLKKFIEVAKTDFLIIPKRCVYSSKKFTDQLLPPIYISNTPTLVQSDNGVTEDITLLSEAIYYNSGKFLCWIYEPDIIALKQKYASQIGISMLDPNDYQGVYYKDLNVGKLIIKINNIPNNISSTDKLNFVQFKTHKLSAMSLHSIYQLYTLNERHGIYKDFETSEDIDIFINNVDIDTSGAIFDIPTARFENMVSILPGKIKQIMFYGLPAYDIFSDIGGWVNDNVFNPVEKAAVSVKDAVVDELLCPNSNNELLDREVGDVLPNEACEAVRSGIDGAVSGKLTDKAIGALINKDGTLNPASKITNLNSGQAAQLFADFYDETYGISTENTQCKTLVDFQLVFFDRIGNAIPRTKLNTHINLGVLEEKNMKMTYKEYNESVEKVPTIGVNTDIFTSLGGIANIPNQIVSSATSKVLSIELNPIVHVINNFGNQGTFEVYAGMKEGKALPPKQSYYPSKLNDSNTVHRYILLGGTLDPVNLPTDYQEEQQYVTGQQTSSVTNTTDGIAISIEERTALYDTIDFPKNILFRDTAFDTYTFLTPGGTMVKKEKEKENEYNWELEDGGELISVYGSSYPPVDNNGNSLTPGWVSIFSTVYKMNGYKNEGQDYVLYPALQSAQGLIPSIKGAMWLGTGAVGEDLQRDPSNTTQYKDLLRHIHSETGIPKNSFSTCLFNGAIGLLIQYPDSKWKFYQLKLNNTNPPTYGWYEVNNFFINTRIWGTRMSYSFNQVIPEKIVGALPEDYHTQFRTIKGDQNLNLSMSVEVKIRYTDASEVKTTIDLRDDKINVIPANVNGDIFFIEFGVDADDINTRCSSATGGGTVTSLFSWYPKNSLLASDGNQYRISEPWTFNICNDVIRGFPVTTPLGDCIPGKIAFSRVRGGQPKSSVKPYQLPVLNITDKLLAEQGSIPSGGGGGDPFKKARDKKTGKLFDYITLDKTTQKELFGNLKKKYPWEGDEDGAPRYIQSRETSRYFIDQAPDCCAEGLPYKWVAICVPETHEIISLFQIIEGEQTLPDWVVKYITPDGKDVIGPLKDSPLAEYLAPSEGTGTAAAPTILNMLSVICPPQPYGDDGSSDYELPPEVTTGTDSNKPTVDQINDMKKKSKGATLAGSLKLLCEYDSIVGQPLDSSMSYWEDIIGAVRSKPLITPVGNVPSMQSYNNDNKMIFNTMLGTVCEGLDFTAGTHDPFTSVYAAESVNASMLAEEFEKDLIPILDAMSNTYQTKAEGIKAVAKAAKSLYLKRFCSKEQKCKTPDTDDFGGGAGRLVDT